MCFIVRQNEGENLELYEQLQQMYDNFLADSEGMGDLNELIRRQPLQFDIEELGLGDR